MRVKLRQETSTALFQSVSPTSYHSDMMIIYRWFPSMHCTQINVSQTLWTLSPLPVLHTFCGELRRRWSIDTADINSTVHPSSISWTLRTHLKPGGVNQPRPQTLIQTASCCRLNWFILTISDQAVHQNHVIQRETRINSELPSTCFHRWAAPPACNEREKQRNLCLRDL